MFGLFRRTAPQRSDLSTTATLPAGVWADVDSLIRLRLRARQLHLETLQQSASTASGAHRSRFRGRGIDYQESRNYQPGDDIRNMDWRVMARTGRPHTKLYQEERQRPVILTVDLGASLFFGSRVALKSVVAAQAAALLAWAAIYRGDRVGALIFGRGQHQELRPAGGRRGVLRLIQALSAWTRPPPLDQYPPDSLGEALQRLRRVVRPGSLVFILSDFYSLDADTEQHLTRLRQHNDIVACQILDPLELTPPPAGRYSITDGRRTALLDTHGKALRTVYEAHFYRQHEQVRRLLRKRAVPLLRLTTQDDVATALRRGLANPVSAPAMDMPAAETAAISIEV